MDISLRYVGYRNGRGDPTFLYGVPARDLTAGDVRTCGHSQGALLASKLYKKVKMADTIEKIEEVNDGDGDKTPSQNPARR